MEQKREMKEMYDILMAVPGMELEVALNVKVKKMNVLLLVQLVHQALHLEGKGEHALLGILSKESIEELKLIVDDFLLKAKLVELNERMLKFRNR